MNDLVYKCLKNISSKLKVVDRIKKTLIKQNVARVRTCEIACVRMCQSREASQNCQGINQGCALIDENDIVLDWIESSEELYYLRIAKDLR